MGKDKPKDHEFFKAEPDMISPFMDEKPIVITEKANWRIDADIDPDLKIAGLGFLGKGIPVRKVAIHCGITIDKIKRI